MKPGSTQRTATRHPNATQRARCRARRVPALTARKPHRPVSSRRDATADRPRRRTSPPIPSSIRQRRRRFPSGRGSRRRVRPRRVPRKRQLLPIALSCPRFLEATAPRGVAQGSFLNTGPCEGSRRQRGSSASGWEPEGAATSHACASAPSLETASPLSRTESGCRKRGSCASLSRPRTRAESNARPSQHLADPAPLRGRSGTLAQRSLLSPEQCFDHGRRGTRSCGALRSARSA
jgi:hypothetical protein